MRTLAHFQRAILPIVLCGCPAPAIELADHPPVVEATEGWHVTVAAHMPTDVRFGADGQFEILDGYASGDTRVRFTDLPDLPAVDVDGLDLGPITDVAARPEGGWYAVDPLASRVHTIDSTGQAIATFGRHGYWVGYLAKPTSVASGPDGTLLVTDSALRAVQLFDADGDPLGLVQIDGAPFRPAFPVAIEADGKGAFLVLDAGTGHADAAVWGFHLDSAAVASAREQAAHRWLRVPLVDPDGVDCVQCHAGAINDSRKVWDPAKHNHPVGILPDRTLPVMFPLDSEGRLQCETCHSPHGESKFTRLPKEGSKLCIACHEEARHDTTVHAAAVITEGCLGCHAVHGAADKALARDVSDARVCGSCHEAAVDHGPECLSCHDVHEKGRDLLATLDHASTGDPNGCVECHADAKRFPHPMDGKMHDGSNNPLTCGSCHDPHEPKKAVDCVSCHFAEGSPDSPTAHATVGCEGCHPVHTGTK